MWYRVYYVVWPSPSLLLLQVCREFQRGNCARGETDCRFAHPSDSPMIDATDNTVTVCMDYIKSRCSREKCKYFHPPAHLQAKIKSSQQQVSQAGSAASNTAAAMVRKPSTLSTFNKLYNFTLLFLCLNIMLYIDQISLNLHYFTRFTSLFFEILERHVEKTAIIPPTLCCKLIKWSSTCCCAEHQTHGSSVDVRHCCGAGSNKNQTISHFLVNIVNVFCVSPVSILQSHKIWSFYKSRCNLLLLNQQLWSHLIKYKQ